jgi:hypothetical protein
MHSQTFEPSSFQTRLLSANALAQRGFKEWLFHPGMLFGSDRKWWGNGGTRTAPHEGIDLFLYRDNSSATQQLRAGAKIPAVFDGTIVQVCDDFLGKSVFVRHDGIEHQGNRLLTIYGHVSPGHGMHRSAAVTGGETIASIADAPAVRDTGVPPHLHLSAAWISDSVSPAGLDWDNLRDERGIELVDPLGVLDLPHSCIEPGAIDAMWRKRPTRSP